MEACECQKYSCVLVWMLLPYVLFMKINQVVHFFKGRESKQGKPVAIAQKTLSPPGFPLSPFFFFFLLHDMWWLSGKESACDAGATRDENLTSASERSPGEGHGNPFQYSGLQNSMERGVWRAAVDGVAKSQTLLKRLSTHVGSQFSDQGLNLYPLHWNLES